MLEIFSISLAPNKEAYSEDLDNLAKSYGIVPKIKSYATGLHYTFEFQSAELKKKFAKDVSTRIPDLFK